MADPREDPSPQVFMTLPAAADNGLRYEFAGFSPRAGDLVERDGEVTVYEWVRPEELPRVPEYAPHGFFLAQHPSGHHYVQMASSDGRPTRVELGQFGPDSRQRSGPFEVDGHPLQWTHEFIRDVTPEGREFTWEAVVCVPVAARHPGVLWTAARTTLSEERRRTSSSTARNARRVRLEGATVERFDPAEVFERDGWHCGLCGGSVDRELRWPDPASASLDHVVPLVAGGAHSRANTQLAHWLCNVRKGARTEDSDVRRLR
jgi:5-methylcytosine-specific restriction endonuclease McrA